MLSGISKVLKPPVWEFEVWVFEGIKIRGNGELL
jgi:hypothetical protein